MARKGEGLQRLEGSVTQVESRTTRLENFGEFVDGDSGESLKGQKALGLILLTHNANLSI